MIVTIGQTVFADSQTQFSAMLLEIALASLILELQKYLSPPVLILAKNGQYKQKKNPFTRVGCNHPETHSSHK
jgi:hypothetical protein